ncbi:MAG: TonB-dependent receptor [Salegentibacter sp.]
MKSRILFMLLVVATFVVHGQNTFKGHITDSETQQPVAGATIYFPQLEKGTVTDLDGNFLLKNLPNGSYKLLISSIGYSSYSQDISLPAKDLALALEPSAIEMEEVIVSTPFHQLQSQNVMRVEREDVSELNRKGAVTLSDGITQMAGVESLTTGVGIGKPVIRGLSSNRVLVYTQGVRLENQQFGGEHGLGISSKGIGSVEVIKGPASLLYGSDAIGGVLYLNPEPYAAANSTNADVEIDYFSNTQGYQGSAMAETSGKKLKFLARGSYATHSDYKTGDGQRVTNTRFNEKDLKTGIGYQGKNYKADLRYNYNRTNVGIPEKISEQTTDKDLTLPFQKIDNNILSLDNKIFLPNSSFDFKVGYEFNNRREFEDNPEDPSLEMHLETFNYNLKYNLPDFGKLKTIVGVQGMDQTNRNLGEEILIPDARTDDFGIFGTSHYDLEKWDFQGGLRFDVRHIKTENHGSVSDSDYRPEVNRSFQSLNAALGAKYDLTEHLSGRLNLASGFRAPNLAELTSHGKHEGTNRYEIGNPDLQNERNLQTDLSLEWRNQHFEAFVNGFHNSINNYIFISPTGETMSGAPVYDYVQNDAHLYGGEIGVHIHPHPLDWLHLESSFETVTGKKDNGGYLPLIPANSWTNTFRVEFNKAENLLSSKYAFVRLKNVFDQNNPGAFETRTGGYGLLGAGIGGSLNFKSSEIDISISGNNLTDRTYISHLSRLKTDNIPNIGRNIMVSVEWLLR